MVGNSIGHYRISGKLGAGGMGEVYRATDTKLGRDVALKVLPEAFGGDAQRMQRFQREAQVLASLNHPNIATIHGVEESGATRALVMELVEGPTLAERIASGPLALEHALPIAKQIAEALEYAHEHGVVHRDLKPANIKLTADGLVKVLDFGLAKALADEGGSPDLANSPTISLAATRAGIILGTAAYMSPEQARGGAVDRRTDIWAFGVVLLEMLTGRNTFAEETISDTLASVLKTDPEWKGLPPETPGSIRRLIERCLDRDRKQRLQAIGEARVAIERALAHPEGEPAAATPAAGQGAAAPSVWRRALPWITGAAGLVLAVALLTLWRPAAEPLPVSRFALGIPASHTFVLVEAPAVAISADGRHAAFAVSGADGKSQILVREMDSLEAQPLAGAEGGSAPFFSPDGQWIGFVAEGKLKKVAVSGGPPVTLTDGIGQFRGAAWGDGFIVYSPNATEPLFRIADGGGMPQPVTQLNAAKKERTHRWPQLAPDGDTVFFTVGSTSSPEYYEDAVIEAVSLKTGQRTVVHEGASMARYLSSGHLVFANEGNLYAVPFDLKTRKETGPPVSILQGVQTYRNSGAAHFDLSRGGSLLYIPGSAKGWRSVLGQWDRNGKEQIVPLAAGSHEQPALSPDGKRLAMVVTSSKNSDIWTYDFQRNTLSRLTFEGNNINPVWTPDGQRIIFSSSLSSPHFQLYWKPSDGSGQPEQLMASAGQALANSVSADGRFLAVDLSTNDLADIVVLPLQGERKPQTYLSTRFEEWNAAFSPDGKWMAYLSSESGRYEVYVRPFPDTGGKWQISTEGGYEPRWTNGGKELVYFDYQERMISVPVDFRNGFRAGAPQVLFHAAHAFPRNFDVNYAVSADGKRFYMFRPQEESTQELAAVLVQNWAVEVRQRTAAQK